MPSPALKGISPSPHRPSVPPGLESTSEQRLAGMSHGAAWMSVPAAL